MKERRKVLDALIIGGVSVALLTTGVAVKEGLEEAVNPTPRLELSNSPEQLVFSARSNVQIEKGIMAAMGACMVKDVAIERQEGRKEAIKVTCERGTLKTATVIATKP